MEPNAFESLITPYTKLAQANVELMKKMPQPAGLLPTGWSNVRDSVAPHQQPQPAPMGPYAGFMLELMGNWVQFWSDLGQGSLTLLLQAQEQFATPWQGHAAEPRKGDSGHGKARHGHVRAAS